MAASRWLGDFASTKKQFSRVAHQIGRLAREYGWL